jgi:hypothetical protein
MASMCTALSERAAATDGGDDVVISIGSVQFHAPRGWQSQEASVVEANRQRVQRLNQGIDNSYGSIGAPKYVFAKYANGEHHSVIPSLSVFATRQRVEPLAAGKEALAGISKVDGTRVVEAPHALRLAKHDAALFRVVYRSNDVHDTVVMEARVIMIAGDADFVVFSFVSPTAGADRCEPEFRALLRSIEALEKQSP